MKRNHEFEKPATPQDASEGDVSVEFEELRLEVLSQLEAAMDILPDEDQMIGLIAEARRAGDLKRVTAEAELLALRMEMAYTTSMLEEGKINFAIAAKMVAKMRGNMDGTFQGDRYAVVRWGLDGLASQLQSVQTNKDNSRTED